MRRGTLVAGLLLLAAATGLPVRAGPAPDLWQKAVALAAANQDWVPGTLVMRTDELDGKGQVDKYQEVTLRIRPGVRGEMEPEIVKAVEDGRDVTEKARADEARERAKAQAAQEKAEAGPEAKPAGGGEDSGGEEHTVGFGEGSPFDPDVQVGLAVEPASGEEMIDGRRCLKFAYRMTTKDEEGEAAAAGTAWLDAETGAPRRVRFTPDPLPPHVKRLETTLEYSLTPAGDWQQTRMTLAGTASFLVFKKSFRMDLAASDFFRAPKPAATAGAR